MRETTARGSVVLLVEDNPLNRALLSRRLARRGFTVVEASEATSGIAIARREPIDLILMDMSLPQIGGWAATRLLKADETTRRIPVIALTAHAMASEREAAYAAGCDESETKPIDLPQLLDKMERLLSATRRPATQ